MKFGTFFASLSLLAWFTAIGCQPASTDGPSAIQSEPHDHHHHEEPENLNEGMQLVSDLYGKIKAAFESGDPDDAHDELHEIGDVLEKDMASLVENAEGLDGDVKETITGLLTDLFTSFGKLDDVLHGGPDVDFQEVDQDISAAMEKLKELIQ